VIAGSSAADAFAAAVVFVQAGWSLSWGINNYSRGH